MLVATIFGNNLIGDITIVLEECGWGPYLATTIFVDIYLFTNFAK